MTDANDSDYEHELTAKLTELTKSLESITEKLAPLEAVRADLNTQKTTLRAQYEEQMAALTIKDKALEDAMWEAKKQVRALQRDVESTQRQYEQARKVREQSEKFEKLSSRWDALTMGAPWREWAKDHQLDAARRMAWQTKMILADGMGLGKTLSAIAALDMIKGATAEATPENPVVLDVEV
jgi:SNF2 family DNA or RNA helicase